MSAQIRYAYLKGHTWLFRRNYPVDVAMVLGSKALKQSLKTGDTATARVRAAEANARFEALVTRVRSTAEEALSAPESNGTGQQWVGNPSSALAHLRTTLEDSGAVPATSGFSRIVQPRKLPVSEASGTYLNRRSNELRPGGFKSVRYSVGLFASKYGERSVCSLTRADGREFLGLIARLSYHPSHSLVILVKTKP
jgi:uncharacterized protein DUF6538